jgi:hypothetical protein
MAVEGVLLWEGRVVEQATSSCPSGYQPDALKWRDPACHCQSPAYIALNVQWMGEKTCQNQIKHLWAGNVQS